MWWLVVALLDEDRLDPCRKFTKIKETAKMSEVLLLLHLDRLQNKYTNCVGIKNNINFGQITGIQEKLDTTCK
jgi:hypothetical protein